jgi:hypothetical protein
MKLAKSNMPLMIAAHVAMMNFKKSASRKRKYYLLVLGRELPDDLLLNQNQ